jgi:hypothetical protein
MSCGSTDNNSKNQKQTEPSSVIVKLLELKPFDFGNKPKAGIEVQKWMAKLIFMNTPGKIIFRSFAGQGCDWFIKRESIDSEIEVFFMHGAEWGQYGPNTSSVDKLNEFAEGSNIGFYMTSPKTYVAMSLD